MRGIATPHVLWIVITAIVIAIAIVFLTRMEVINPVEMKDKLKIGKLAEENMHVTCGEENTIRLEKINFIYHEEKEINFFMVADFKEKLIWKDEVLNYPNAENVMIEFKTDEELEEKEFITLSVWKESECVKDFIKETEIAGKEGWYCCNAKKQGSCYITETDKTITIEVGESIDLSKGGELFRCESLGGIENNYECTGTPPSQCQPIWDEGMYQRQFGNCITKCRSLGGSSARFGEAQPEPHTFSDLLAKCPADYLDSESVGFNLTIVGFNCRI